ncbi:alpha/beta fold hydrolase [Paludibacterium purpuratum]|uniref:Pimeloyl-ACP methyl ester carboxylesterase n=1 Tax=Paludibacterium purpuratum TaxID=1144873 RepID=A0A4R7B812_9NEIS|nr:alpha/beta hydrolase [Paludibacterium purpuratum]TDR79727.1 pimeloyl-ACP methyl ester carboxylesterase [Paludibacterium purpuratum]
MSIHVAVAGTSINYTAIGTGPALVLVHGTSIDGQGNFGHVAQQFADRRTVVIPNYGGTGGSTIPDGPLALDTLVEQIAATIRHASTEPVDLLGDSLGAVVAAATAARHPELVRRLVLVAGWADSADTRHQMVFSTWRQLLDGDVALCNRYAFALAVSPAFLTALGADTLAALLEQSPPPDTHRRVELGLRIDLKAALAHITAPTLVVQCRQDYLVPAYQTRQLQQGIAGSQYVEIDSGHAAFVEKPDELVAIVRRFCLD